MWLYMISYFSEHILWIEAIMRCWYKPDYCFLRETLSWKYPTIALNEHEYFNESMNWPSDLVPSVTFLLPNMFWTEKLSEWRMLRIEFWKAWVIWVDNRY
jgi:hypothetical protein